MDYDAALIGYEELLDEFWSMHSGRNHGYRGRQYISLLLYRTQEEKATAEKKLLEWQEKKGQLIETEIAAFHFFTRAEDYHQKYFLRRFPKAVRPLLAHFGESGITDDVLAAKLNAAAHGDLTIKEIREGFPYWTEDEAEQRTWIELLSKVKW